MGERVRPGKGEKILVGDGDRARAEQLREVLERAGYTVVIALSGPEALAMATSGQPRLMVLDAELPEVSGYQVAARLSVLSDHQQAYDIPVILLREYPGWDMGPWDRGVSAYLTRPFNPLELLTFVKRILTSQEKADTADKRYDVLIYRPHDREESVLPPPPDAPQATCCRLPVPPEGSAVQALSILEEALAVARGTPPRLRHELLAAAASVLAWIDAERAFTMLEEEVSLTDEARAWAGESIALTVPKVPHARVQEWLTRARRKQDSVYYAARAAADADPAHALSAASALRRLAERVEWLSILSDMTPEPYRTQARSELLSALDKIAHHKVRRPRAMDPWWVADLLAEMDPLAALTFVAGLPPGDERGEAFRSAASKFEGYAPHLLPELLALAEASPAAARGHALAVVVGPLSMTDPPRALAAAREITEPGWRSCALRSLLPALAAADPVQAWELVVEAATSAARSPEPWLRFFDTSTLAAVAQHLTERADELLPLLAHGALGDAGMPDLFLLHLAPWDRARALRLLDQRPEEGRWSGTVAVLRGASRTDPEWVLESVLSLPDPACREMAIAIAPALAEVDPCWAVELAERTGSTAVATRGAVHARWWPSNPPAAAELAELALQAEPSTEVLPHLAVLLAPANPDRAMEVARSLDDPKGKVHTMLDIAERVMGVEAQW